jgi:ABC-type transporter Mla subunit MlaD
MSGNSLSQETKNNSPELKEQSSSVAQTVQDAAADVSQKAQDWAANVANKAQETASAALDKTNEGIAAVGQQMNTFGGTVRQAAPRDGVIGTAATAVADNLQAGGRYLEEHGLQDMGKDITAMIRQYPIQSVLAGFGLGCLLGMTLLRRR